MVTEELNNFGERIETRAGITLNLEYWDCECDNVGFGYIHPISENECVVCKSIQDELPSQS